MQTEVRDLETLAYFQVDQDRSRSNSGHQEQVRRTVSFRRLIILAFWNALIVAVILTAGANGNCHCLV
jgi:hypothetical protein